jgi:hypothetical protein
MFAESWDRALTAAKTKALAHATNIIDSLAYIGKKTDPNQVNEFPRDPGTTVPQDVKDATSEIALALLDGIDPEREREAISLESQGYSSARSTYNRNFVQAHVSAGVPSASAWNLLRKYIKDVQDFKIRRV